MLTKLLKTATQRLQLTARTHSFSTGSAINYDALRAQYAKNGFAVVPNFLTPVQCDAMLAHTASLTQKFVAETTQDQASKTVFKSGQAHRGTSFLETGDKVHFFYEDGVFDDATQTLKVDPHLAFNKIGHAMHDLDAFFERFCYRNAYARILRALGYATPQLVQTMYIFKNPRVGGEVSPHTDNSYLITRPLSTIGFWLALHDARKDNGCLWGIPASHKRDTTYFMHRDARGENTYYAGEKPKYALQDGVPLEADRGTLIFFDGNFVHWSAHNTSDAPRHAFTLHFVESARGYEWRADNWLQRGSHLPFRNYY